MLKIYNKYYYIYILTNENNTTLYVGVTNDLPKRIYEHKNKFADDFSKKYNLNKLVYYELFNDVYSAIKREKQLKNWYRQWKINLIEQNNKKWEDLYYKLV